MTKTAGKSSSSSLRTTRIDNSRNVAGSRRERFFFLPSVKDLECHPYINLLRISKWPRWIDPSIWGWCNSPKSVLGFATTHRRYRLTVLVFSSGAWRSLPPSGRYPLTGIRRGSPSYPHFLNPTFQRTPKKDRKRDLVWSSRSIWDVIYRFRFQRTTLPTLPPPLLHYQVSSQHFFFILLPRREMEDEGKEEVIRFLQRKKKSHPGYDDSGSPVIYERGRRFLTPPRAYFTKWRNLSSFLLHTMWGKSMARAGSTLGSILRQRERERETCKQVPAEQKVIYLLFHPAAAVPALPLLGIDPSTPQEIKEGP